MGGRGGSTCGASGWDGAIVREKLHFFDNTFGAGPRNVDAVTSVITALNTIGAREYVPEVEK